MTEHQTDTLFGIAMLVSIIVGAAICMRCTPAEATDGRVEYASGNEVCVRMATSEAQARDCLAREHYKWCDPYTGLTPDAGICDGGTHEQ